jgi:Nitrile hydratase, alpha chain
MDHDEWEAKYSKLVAKAWMDEDFKKRFLANPAAVLEEEGLEVPTYVRQVNVVEGTDHTLDLIFPAKPTGELSEEDLESFAASAPYTWCHWCKIDEEVERFEEA